MTEQFFDQPILNSPYQYPARHWELEDGLPTSRILERRRSADFITPIPKPKKRKQSGAQQLDLLYGGGFAEDETGLRYNPTQFIQGVREQVDEWRRLPNPESWRVTPETARLLQHWRTSASRKLMPPSPPKLTRNSSTTSLMKNAILCASPGHSPLKAFPLIAFWW